MRKRNRPLRYFILIFISWSGALAQNSTPQAATSPPPVPAKSSQQKPTVLDFDADVIEGERKTPSVFLEIGAENPTMDSVIFQRNDFNDLHGLDSKRRQQYQPLYSK